MLLINGHFYNPAFITCAEDVSNEESDFICLYFSVPVQNSIPCVALTSNKPRKITLCASHRVGVVDVIDAWMIEAETPEDIQRIRKYLRQ